MKNRKYHQGYFDCVAETLKFLIGADGSTVDERLKTRMLQHLTDYYAEAMTATPRQEADAGLSANNADRKRCCSPDPATKTFQGYWCSNPLDNNNDHGNAIVKNNSNDKNATLLINAADSRISPAATNQACKKQRRFSSGKNQRQIVQQVEEESPVFSAKIFGDNNNNSSKSCSNDNSNNNHSNDNCGLDQQRFANGSDGYSSHFHHRNYPHEQQKQPLDLTLATKNRSKATNNNNHNNIINSKHIENKAGVKNLAQQNTFRDHYKIIQFTKRETDDDNSNFIRAASLAANDNQTTIKRAASGGLAIATIEQTAASNSAQVFSCVDNDTRLRKLLESKPDQRRHSVGIIEEINKDHRQTIDSRLIDIGNRLKFELDQREQIRQALRDQLVTKTALIRANEQSTHHGLIYLPVIVNRS